MFGKKLEPSIYYLLATWMAAAGLSSSRAQDVPAMVPGLTPSFEVASIRPSDPNDHSSGFHTDGHRIYIENETLETLVMFAYSVHKSQIVGGPDWMSTARFDIKGVPDAEGEPNQQQEEGMLRKLLTDRFAFTFQEQMRTLPIYALTIAKSGGKLQKSKGDPEGLPDQTGNSNNTQQDWHFTNNSMDDFAQFLQSSLERPVVNLTQLKGRFDFLLKWSSNDAPVSDTSAPPVLFTALREQLGMAIEPTKGPVRVLSITHVERPTAN